MLVHGAFVDQTSWQPVADILSKQGYNVTLMVNPLTSLATDSVGSHQGSARKTERQNRLLVGHSLGRRW